MDCDIFPCSICDNLVHNANGLACRVDILGRPIEQIHECPENHRFGGKKDIGKWVVQQPDGLLCYYCEEPRQIIGCNLTFRELVDVRMVACDMPMEDVVLDTRNQLEHRPVRWEDVVDLFK